MTGDRLKVWDWRDAVRQDKNLQPYTKLVLYTVAIYMNGLGEGAFPSYKTLAADCGLHRTTVIAHMKLACAAGYLEKETTHRGDGTHTSNRYSCRYPDTVAFVQQELEIRGGTATGGGSHTRPPPCEQPVDNEGGVVAIDYQVVAIDYPILTPPINSKNPLTPFGGEQAGRGQGQDFPEQSAAGRTGADQPVSADDVIRLVRKLTPGVHAMRLNRQQPVTVESKQATEEVLGELRAHAQPAGMHDLMRTVVTYRAGLYAKPDLEKLQSEFAAHGWQQDLSGLPLWAVRAAFQSHRDEHKARRPRAAEIAVRARDLVKPLGVAIADCDRYLRLPITPVEEGLSAEQRAELSLEFERLRATLAATPGPEPQGRPA